MKTQQMLVPFDLTDEEMSRYGRELAERLDEQQALEDKKKKFLEQVRRDDAEIQGAINQLTSKLRDGTEDRMVDCEVRRIPEQNVIEFIRLDNGVVAESRPMTPAERQEEIDFTTSDDDIPSFRVRKGREVPPS